MCQIDLLNDQIQIRVITNEREREMERKKEGNPRTRDESVPARRSDPSTVGSVGVREKERLGRKGLSRTVM